MKLARIFANAVVRRVAYVLVAAVLAWLGIGTARADDHADQGEAYAHCMSEASQIAGSESNPPGENKHSPKCHATANTSGVVYGYRACWQGRFYLGAGMWSAYGQMCVDWTHNFPSDKKCDARQDFTTTFAPKSGSVGCNAGCEVAYFATADGTTSAQWVGTPCSGEHFPPTCTGAFYWNPLLNVCEPNGPQCEGGASANSLGQCGPEPCPPGMTQGPDGTCQPKKPECPAGQQKAPDGSCIDNQCPAGYVKGPDGTCKKDDDGNGQEDDDEPESFSGGDSCDQPPACSGSAIMCGQARIQWRIDCNTRKNRNIAGGSCAAMPVCSGEKCDAVEYASLIQQWKASCHLEKLARDGLGGGGGDDGSAVVDLLTGAGSHNPNAVGGDTLSDGGPSGPGGGGGDDEVEPDSSGYGYSRSCPSPPSFTLPNGQSVQFDLTPLCNWVSLGGVLVLILAGLMSLRIVSGGTA